MDHVDTLLHARWIIPVEPENLVYEHYSIAIRHGHIVALLPTAEARRLYQATDTIELNDHAVIPGLINAHAHAAMSLFRGLADDLPLMTWLNDHIWPAEGRWVGEDFAYDGTQLAIAEMLRGGITCFSDMYFFPNATARAVQGCGMRAVIGMILIDFPTVWAKNADEYFQKGLQLHASLQDHPLIKTVISPHAPYTVSDEPLKRVRDLSEQLDISIHMHVHETAEEVNQGIQAHGVRPLTRLHNLGLLSPRLLAVHMTQLTADEISLCANTGVHVIHCPESNLKLASGFCPVHKLLQAGVNVALGTDGAASNNDLDMIGEMRSAALLAKAVANDASAVSAMSALQLATLNGARALGLEKVTGSLVTGKAADMAAVYLGDIEAQPLYHPVSQLVYATNRQQVTDVWVAGQRLLNNRRLTTLDINDITRKTRVWQERIMKTD